MQATSSRIGTGKPASSERLPGPPSPALEWLWGYLADVRRPHILHCGPVRWGMIDLLLRRNVKLYLGDAISPLLNDNARFWDQKGKTPVFKLGEFMAEFPPVPPGQTIGWTVAFPAPRTDRRRDAPCRTTPTPRCRDAHWGGGDSWPCR